VIPAWVVLYCWQAATHATQYPSIQTLTSTKMASSEFAAGWHFGAIGSVSAVKLEALSCQRGTTVLHFLAS